MGTVHKITIEQVETICHENGAYDINAYWTVEESAQQSENEYCVEITCEEEVVTTQNVKEKAAHLSAIQLDSQKSYQLCVSSGDKSDSALVLLRTYENPVADYDGVTLRICWDKPDCLIGKGRCLVRVNNGTIFGYEIPIGVCGMEIPMSETVYGSDPLLSIGLLPYSGTISTGPTAELPDLCRTQYSVVSQNGAAQISYRGKKPQEEQMVITLEGEIYRVDSQGKSLRPDKAVTFGPLTLGITSPYTLTVQTKTQLQRAEYDSFVAAVWQLVTVRTMYALLEVIPRCALHNAEDTLYFHCGLRRTATDQSQTNRRCADVRPGFTLRLEQEQYMPQYQLDSPEAAGFVGVHTAEYPVVLEGDTGSEYLVFDSFIAGMDEEIYTSSTQAEVLSAGAGIIDLSAVRMRAAFYRIQYPDDMYASDAQPDIYGDNHPVLVADPSWNYAEEKTYLLFRGRSALTLLLSLMVNGREKKLPVGTTWGSLLGLLGIWEGAGHAVQWYRRDICGGWAQIVGTDQLLRTMPLMNGDRIEG